MAETNDTSRQTLLIGLGAIIVTLSTASGQWSIFDFGVAVSLIGAGLYFIKIHQLTPSNKSEIVLYALPFALLTTTAIIALLVILAFFIPSLSYIDVGTYNAVNPKPANLSAEQSFQFNLKLGRYQAFSQSVVFLVSLVGWATCFYRRSKRDINKTKDQASGALPPAGSSLPLTERSGHKIQEAAGKGAGGKDPAASPHAQQQVEQLLSKPKIPAIYKLLFKLRLIRIEIILTALALLVSLGQYFEDVINVRVSIYNIWGDGYTAENRNRVQRFRHFSKDWKDIHGQNSLAGSVDKLVYTDKLLAPGNLKQDVFIANLFSDEVSKDAQDKDYVAVALKYRNAMIETLNTAEAVKAVIQSRPWPFRSRLLYWDTLEARYKPVVNEIRWGLDDFIISYRNSTPKRDVQAWDVLTTPESNRSDYFAVVILFGLAFLFLILTYYAKKQFKKFIKYYPELE